MNRHFSPDPSRDRRHPQRWHRPPLALSIAVTAALAFASVPTLALADEVVPDAAAPAAASEQPAPPPVAEPPVEAQPLAPEAPAPPEPAPVLAVPEPAPEPVVPAPAETPPAATEPPAAPEPTPMPEPTPTPEPTVEPSTTPTPSATPVPTASPTPVPSTTPAPTPTPAVVTPEPVVPQPTTPLAPVTKAPTPAKPRFVASTGTSSTLAAARLAATQRAAATAKASQLVSTTKAKLATAQLNYSTAKAQYDAAVAAASVLAEKATAAETTAAESTAVLLLALRPSGSPSGDVSAVDVFFGEASEDQVLSQLSTVERLNTLNSDLDALAKQAEGDNGRAAAARALANDALAAADALPLASARDELAAAQRAADDASAALNTLRIATAAAAESFELIVPLPADDDRLSGQAWTAPASGSITDTFGPRPSQPGGAGPFHYAIDIGTGCNAWEYAASAGTVIAAGPFGGLGNRVLIDHGDGITSAYGHIVDGGIAVSVGQRVAAGEAIALSGSTGISTGCHLHFEVAIDGVRTDPLPFLAARGVSVG